MYLSIAYCNKYKFKCIEVIENVIFNKVVILVYFFI